jgi:NADPH-dependent 2,4-dienoyl-CoA reductase/sulfur reductase-like enzyme
MSAAPVTVTPRATAPSSAIASPDVPAEATTTVVIGSGFSALAVAAELNRQGVKAIMVDSFCPVKQSSTPPTTGGISLDALSERSEVVRLLENYARRHDLDIRPETQALELTRAGHTMQATHPWRVHTATGVLSAHSVVFTRGALIQLRQVLHSVGVTTAADMRTGMHALGLYLVGVGDLAIPTTAEILHQAKRAGQSIATRVVAREANSALALA